MYRFSLLPPLFSPGLIPSPLDQARQVSVPFHHLLPQHCCQIHLPQALSYIQAVLCSQTFNGSLVPKSKVAHSGAHRDQAGGINEQSSPQNTVGVGGDCGAWEHLVPAAAALPSPAL